MHRFAWGLFAIAFAFACGDDDGGGGTDAGTDAGDAGVDANRDAAIEQIEDIPVEEEVAIPGLSAPVDAVQDDRGMWHFYGQNIEDTIAAQGYVQAADRMGQMEFIRRQSTGTLGEFAGSFIPSLLEDDADARFDGHRRNAEAIIEALPADQRVAVEAFARGVNVRIERLRNLEVQLPRGVDTVINGDQLVDWTPLDTFAIARLQAASLSLDFGSDLSRTDSLERWREFFPDDAADERIQRLSGAYHDLFPVRPAADVYNIDGYPNVGTDTGTRAIRPPTPRTHDIEIPHVPLRSLEAAMRFSDRQQARFTRLFGDGFRGSNSWVVAGAATESGNPMMANDPHLALTSPSLFWMAHVNTKRAGGDIDAAGQMIAGTPVFLLGFTDRLAWGLTTSGYDVSDAYVEVITPGDPDTVEFEGGQVAIETITETIRDDIGGSTEVVFENVPHHGLIIPGSRTSCEAGDEPPCEVGKDIAISVRWTGNAPSDEAGAFLDLYSAANVDEAREAFRKFEVGGQTLVVADNSGDIYYTSSVNIPIREAAALTYDPETNTGASPCFALDGRGDQEWTGDFLDFRFIPHALNPESNFIATANADPVGVTADGDALNGVDPDDPADDFYITCDFADGHRLGRIVERLTELVSAGNITAADMSELQNDAVSPYGRIVTPMILEQLARVFEERDTPGTHADLTAAVTENMAALARVEMARDRLQAWTSFDTPAAVEGTPAADEIEDSVAASIFNVVLGHLMRLTFDDELDWHANGELDGAPRRSNIVGRTMVFLVNDPESLVSYDDGLGDSVLWDDLNTDDVAESRGDRVLRAVVAALEWLETRFESADMETWRWGQLHTVRLDAIVPAGFLGEDILSIPTPADAMFPNGFPRQGDRGVVDASNFGVFNFEGLDYGSGPQQRLVVEMTPEGPIAVNALPGGNSEDPDSTFHRDEMEHWRFNEVSPVAFTEEQVLETHVRRLRFVP
ncbi:MAG: penicillin acylase family protein [Myxococcota bacterium]